MLVRTDSHVNCRLELQWRTFNATHAKICTCTCLAMNVPFVRRNNGNSGTDSFLRLNGQCVFYEIQSFVNVSLTKLVHSSSSQKGRVGGFFLRAA